MIKFRKLKTGDIVNNHLERWLTFLDKDTPEEVLEEVINMDSAISKANERLNFVSQDKNFLHAYEMREMALSDWTTGVNTAFEKGKMEVAKNLIRRNRSIEEIVEDTGLDAETIISLE